MSADPNGAGKLRQVLDDTMAEGAAHDCHLSMAELTVLSAQRDPYRLDTPASHRDAQWFAQQVERFIGSGTIHLRGIHYQVASSGNVQRPYPPPGGARRDN